MNFHDHLKKTTSTKADVEQGRILPPFSTCLTRTAKGTETVLPKPKAGLFRTVAEGREKPIMPHRAKQIKLTKEFWSSDHIIKHFRDLKFEPEGDNRGWFVHLNQPHRNPTRRDWIELLNQSTYNSHLVHFNLEHKHFIIESLQGND